MIELNYDTTSFELPGQWNDCSTRQFLRLSKLLHTGKDANVNALEALRIAWNKSKFTFYLYMRLWFHSKKFDDLKVRAIQQVKWVFEDQAATDQLLPKYRGLYGPAGGFGNLRMIEFHACEMNHFVYTKDKSELHLNRLVAVLYRPKRKDYNKKQHDDIRIPFHALLCEYNAEKVAKWPRYVKEAILLWYEACRQEMISRNQDVFNSGNAGSAKSYFDGLYGVMRNIAASRIYGEFEKVENLYVSQAMLEMRKAIEEAQEQERIAKQA